MMPMVLVRKDGGVVVLQGGSQKVVGTAVLVFIALLALLGAVRSGEPVSVLVCAVFFIVVGLLCIRWIRTEVRVGPEFLLLRTVFRTYRIPWSHVAGAEVGSDRKPLFAIVQVSLRSGSWINVDGIGRRWRKDYNDSSDVGQMVAEINRRVAT